MVVVDPTGEIARPGHKRDRDDLREELRKLVTPHIRDVKSGMQDELAACLLGTHLSSKDRITAGRAFCESGLQKIRSHSAACHCKDLAPGEVLSEKYLRAMEDNLSTVVIPRMEYSVERDRAAGLLKFYFRVPDLGTRFESYSQPEHALALIEKEQENLAHRVLNADMIPIVGEIQNLLEAHGIFEFQQPEPELDLMGIIGLGGNNGGAPAAELPPPAPPLRPSPVPGRPTPDPGDDEEEETDEELEELLGVSEEEGEGSGDSA